MTVLRSICAVLMTTALALVYVGSGAGVADASTACPPAGSTDALFPAQAAARYDLTPLVERGFTGAGVRVAQIQIGASVDEPTLQQYAQCVGVGPVPLFQHVVGGGATPPPSTEAMMDAEIVAGLAPGIDRLDVFTVSQAGDFVTDLASTLAAALDPANTGGQRVDIISISYEMCEPQLPIDLAPVDTLLQQAAQSGVWVLKGAGDSGSSDCIPKGTCFAPEKYLAVSWPASSPWVTALGGTMLTAGMQLTDTGVTWSDVAACFGTGGGVSTRYSAPSWQANVPGGLSQPMRMVPDAASLAGSPNFAILLPPPPDTPTWFPIGGDSATGPFWSGAMAIVLSGLRAEGVTPPGYLNPVLYQLASDPATYARVFRDVTQGSNDLLQLGCCDAGTGYDLTTGLGEVDFAELAAALGLPPAVTPAGPPVIPAAPVVLQPTFTG